MPKRKPSSHFAKQAQEAYELSLSGLSYRQIAEEMGVSLATVQRRLELYIKDRVHPKADEYRARQIDSLHMYLRALRKPIASGDPKAIANAVRIQERIARLLGLDSATAFKVEVEKTDDRLEVAKLMAQYFGEDPDKITEIPARRKRPMAISPPVVYAKTHNPANEFPDAIPAHQVQEFEQEPQEEFEPAPKPRPKRNRAPNTTAHLLRDYDD